VTYLRQDFSQVQQVADPPGRWPTMQRYDFFVRTREIDASEVRGRVDSEYAETIATTLRALTGRNAPPTAEAWRAILKQP
jgi:hypothetical protein